MASPGITPGPIISQTYPLSRNMSQNCLLQFQHLLLLTCLELPDPGDVARLVDNNEMHTVDRTTGDRGFGLRVCVGEPARRCKQGIAVTNVASWVSLGKKNLSLLSSWIGQIRSGHSSSPHNDTMAARIRGDIFILAAG